MHHARSVNETYRKALGVVEQCRILSLIAQEFYPGYGARSNQLFDYESVPSLFSYTFPFWPTTIETPRTFQPFAPADWNSLQSALLKLRNLLGKWPSKTLEALNERVLLPHLPEEDRKAPFLIQVEKTVKLAKIAGDLVSDLYKEEGTPSRHIGKTILQEALDTRREFLADDSAASIVQKTIQMTVLNATYWKRVARLEAVRNGSMERASSEDLLLSPWNDYTPLLSDPRLYLHPSDPGMSLPQTRFHQIDALALWKNQVSLYEDFHAVREVAIPEVRVALRELQSFIQSFNIASDILNRYESSISRQIQTIVHAYRQVSDRVAKKLAPLMKVVEQMYLRTSWQASALRRALAASYIHEVFTQNLTRPSEEDIVIDDRSYEDNTSSHIALLIARQKGLVPKEATFDDAEIILKVRQIRDSLPSPDLSNPGDRYSALLASVS